MSDSEPDSPVSQFSFDDDEIVWSQDTDFILLRHPHSLSSTVSDYAGHDGDLSSGFDKLSLRDRASPLDTPSTGSDSGHMRTGDLESTRAFSNRKKTRRAQSSSDSSASSEYHSGTSTPTASYDDASAFISRFLSSPTKEKNAELDLLRALIIELGIRPPNTSDLPSTLTSARKMLKAEVHINIKEYVATRHKGQVALRGILKPSKSALRKDIHKGNIAPLKWVKQQGLQVLLVACFT